MKSIKTIMEENKLIGSKTKKLIIPVTLKDKNGNITYKKSIDGVECWKEYDSNNNLTHFKNNDGVEEWSEYDSNNNSTYHKNSDGVECWKEYDDKKLKNTLVKQRNRWTLNGNVLEVKE